MTRREAMEIAEELKPNGFTFNDLTREVATTTDGTEAYRWKASYVDNSDPPQAVIERWWDVYTDADPAPEFDEDETDETVEGEEEVSTNGNGETHAETGSE